MLNYGYAVQMWAVYRKIHELREKIKLCVKRRDEYHEKSLPNGMKSTHVMRSNHALYLSISADIDRYRVWERRAVAIADYIYPFLEQAPQSELDCQVLSYAVSQCGTQRFTVYMNLLKWNAERLHYAVQDERAMVFYYQVNLDAGTLVIVSGDALNAMQQRLFATHGGHGHDFSYAKVYSEVESEWLARVQ